MAYKSGFERSIDADLRARKVAFTYEELEFPYVLNGTYHPDFFLKKTGIVVEAKGVLDRDSKRKMIAIRKQYPDLDIRILFMNASTKVPGTKQTHGQWADRNGYKWAEGKIPEDWVK